MGINIYIVECRIRVTVGMVHVYCPFALALHFFLVRQVLYMHVLCRVLCFPFWLTLIHDSYQ
jgi:hypothetical protein